jgi:hypothetical protein
MVTLTARTADAFEALMGLQEVGSGLLLAVALVLLAPIAWGYVAAIPTRDARRAPTLPTQIGARLHWRRTSARQRAWMSSRNATRSSSPPRRGAIRPGRPSPPIKRLRVRAAFLHPARDWQTIRYPH